MFRLTVKPNAQATLAQIRANNPIQRLLDSRTKLTPEEYTRRMDKRDEDYNKCNWQPGDSLEELAEDAYYLLKVDEKWRRTYAKKAAPRL
jgi:hydroxymethylglutaryl-CoA synthase